MTMKPLFRCALLLAVVTLLASCGGGGDDAGGGAAEPQVTLQVSNGAGVSGNLVITLARDRAPATVANFLAYVNAGFYDGTVFHRHAPNFVLQGGGYAGPLVAGGAVPTPKATNPPVALEVGRGLSNLRFTVAMARTSEPTSATSQFFINLVDNPALDTSAGGYAVFGVVSSGTAVLSAMVAANCTPWPGFLFTGECLPSPNITIVRATRTR